MKKIMTIKCFNFVNSEKKKRIKISKEEYKDIKVLKK